MQQRQLRLGDILDDYCSRERRLTNHAVVAMVGEDVKQTRCTTCETEHEYKHAKVPRQRRKGEEPAALYAQVLGDGPKRVTHDAPAGQSGPVGSADSPSDSVTSSAQTAPPSTTDADAGPEDSADVPDVDRAGDGPVHRTLIRATLPRQEGQAPPARPAPDFTIRQPAGRQNRFRPQNQRGGQTFQGNRSRGSSGSSGSTGGGFSRGGAPRQNGGRPPQGATTSHLARRNDAGRKRSK
jgi:uncharacterized membrane protein YgcG